MNALGLDVSSVGNHEFDEGYKELQRMQNGGCLPDGDGVNNQNSCPDPATPFTGADFDYLAANVEGDGTGKTILPAYSIKKVARRQGRLHRNDARGHAEHRHRRRVSPACDFSDEVETANALVPQLKAQGVEGHRGAACTRAVCADRPLQRVRRASPARSSTSPKNLDPEIDAIVSGHTHAAYNCTIPDPAGKPRLVTSASSFGRLVTEIDLTHRPAAPATSSAPTIDAPPTRSSPRDDAKDPAMTALIAKYKDAGRPDRVGDHRPGVRPGTGQRTPTPQASRRSVT